jgi:protocatechuate 3,4-dioxygenase beta subunit
MFAAAARAEDAPAVPKGEITGTVVNEDAQPIEGALVDAWTWYPGNETHTDKAGRFHLKKLDPRQKIEFRISKDGFDPFYNIQQESGVGLQITLNNHTYIEGNVLSPDNKPVPGALIRANNGPKYGDGFTMTSIWTETKSDAQGHYRLYLLPDNYELQIRVPGVGAARYPKTTVKEGDTTTLDIQLEKGIAFQAKLVDSETSAPVPNVHLDNWEQKGVEGTSDKDGQVTIDGMQPGPFKFAFSAKGYAMWWSAQGTQPYMRKRNEKLWGNWDEIEFDLEPDMAPVNIVMEKAVTITGRVVDPDGKPVSGATVAPAKTGTANSITGDTRFSFTTKGDGSFDMTLPASMDVEYDLVAHDGKYGQWRKWANGVGEPITTKPGQQIANVKLALTRGATLSGTVVDSTGAPLADREVRTQPTDKLENRYYDPTTRTDKQGHYVLKFVRPTEQRIEVDPFDSNDAGASQIVTVQPDDKKEVNLTGITDAELEHRKAEWSRPPHAQ